MEIQKALEFVRANHRAVLITRHADGRVQTSPVTVGVGAGDRVVISSRETAVKIRNVRANPEVVLTVMTDAFYGQWLQLDGTAEVISLPEAMEPLVDYYRDISGEHPDWDDYRTTMERDRRVIISVTVTKAGPDFHG
ncbi:PPOX class F420-dependent oxidoreductase [Herbidospora mongoliensis]|uniref:PPOX class F420-dependent oxidoreductase n=1 Tax=Herbidospora mongoliensis TaxID=688067 RepID=UPI000833006B|nr:PPOX class F420-dependent oxidoreductase [Herbidospora mongoliensis]